MPRTITSGSGTDGDGTERSLAQPVPDAPARSGRLGCAAVFLFALLILAVLGGFIFYRMERTARDSASLVRDAIVAVTGMQPRVTVNEQVVFEEARPVLELAVLERDAVVERETDNQWMGSTRHLRIRGLYHIKVGYDLTKDFKVDVVGNAAEVVRLQLPSPRVLTVEQKDFKALTMDDGLWNHLSKEELATEINLLSLEAHLKAQQNGTPAEAQRMFIQQLQGKLGPGHRVEIVPPPSPAQASPPPLK